MRVIKDGRLALEPKLARITLADGNGSHRRVLIEDEAGEEAKWPCPASWSLDGRALAILMAEGNVWEQPASFHIEIGDTEGTKVRSIPLSEVPGATRENGFDWR